MFNAPQKITKTHPITLVNSVNPYRIEGQKTGAFEVVDALGDAPTFHSIPVGNAGNITAYWKLKPNWASQQYLVVDSLNFYAL